ncbi:nuclear transport factor 2 family protein [Streptomyces sp. KLOTTS4A1]|uniref:nuclear transport factor 2 family protein n=1 Tax=Streptomyces sp. KLOTTS4A1 TaxID=3390996 RepID=UPI0039F4F208
MTPHETARPRIHPVFLKQLDALARHDLDALMATYHPEAEWLRLQGVVKGREAIRERIAQDWALGLDFIGMHEYMHSDDTIMARCIMAVRGEKVVTSGTYVLRDEMIWRVVGADEGGVRVPGSPGSSGGIRPVEPPLPVLDHSVAGLLGLATRSVG